MHIKTILTVATVAAGLSGPVMAEDFALSSTDIAEGQHMADAQVFQGFGCKGGNISPQLSWSGAPEGTAAYALTAYDPDAPTGSGWWHWFAFNIPADVTSIEAGAALPKGAIALKNDYGVEGFGGACPPPGEVHRYQFTIHALPEKLNLDASVSNALAGYMVRANSLASATLTSVYTRK